MLDVNISSVKHEMSAEPNCSLSLFLRDIAFVVFWGVDLSSTVNMQPSFTVFKNRQMSLQTQKITLNQQLMDTYQQG